MYMVIYFNCSATSPGELQLWLNEWYKDGFELVGVVDNYFIFRNLRMVKVK